MARPPKKRSSSPPQRVPAKKKRTTPAATTTTSRDPPPPPNRVAAKLANMPQSVFNAHIAPRLNEKNLTRLAATSKAAKNAIVGGYRGLDLVFMRMIRSAYHPPYNTAIEATFTLPDAPIKLDIYAGTSDPPDGVRDHGTPWMMVWVRRGPVGLSDDDFDSEASSLFQADMQLKRNWNIAAFRNRDMSDPSRPEFKDVVASFDRAMRMVVTQELPARVARMLSTERALLKQERQVLATLEGKLDREERDLERAKRYVAKLTANVRLSKRDVRQAKRAVEQRTSGVKKIEGIHREILPEWVKNTRAKKLGA